MDAAIEKSAMRKVYMRLLPFANAGSGNPELTVRSHADQGDRAGASQLQHRAVGIVEIGKDQPVSPARAWIRRSQVRNGLTAGGRGIRTLGLA